MPKHLYAVIRDNPLRMFSLCLLSLMLGMTGVLAVQRAARHGPGVVIHQESDDSVTIDGLMLTVVIDMDKSAPLCEGAHTTRRFRHYPASVKHPEAGMAWDDEVTLTNDETAIDPDETGRFKFTLRLRMPFSLPVHSTGNWFSDQRVHTNCNFLPWLASQFADRPVPAPPVLVTIVGPMVGATRPD